MVLYVSFSRVPGFSVILDHRGRLGGSGGNVESACKEFEDNESGILGSVSESSGTGSRGLSHINGCRCRPLSFISARRY